ncbi:MAG: hypothetical protein HC799_16160 [Limnothrix sp. RL_2_0]|nr:hypothetical protein [Limnothrix sp. RL_2_0]
MSSDFRPVPRASLSAGNILATYDRAGQLLGSGRIEEFAAFRLPALAANVSKSVDMATIGYPIRLDAVQLLGSSVVTSITLGITTVDGQSSFFQYAITNDFCNLPGILIPDDAIFSIGVNGSINGAIAYAKQIGIVENQTLAFET